jgi:hypothetical protein
LLVHESLRFVSPEDEQIVFAALGLVTVEATKGVLIK